MKTFLLNSVGYILFCIALILFLIFSYFLAQKLGGMLGIDDKFISCIILGGIYIIIFGSMLQAYEDAFAQEEKKSKQKLVVKIINKDEDNQEFTCNTVEAVSQGDHYKVIMNDGWVITHPGSSIQVQPNS